MTVREILAGVALEGGIPAELAETPVAGLAYDSRGCGPGFLFFAFPGQRVDGRAFASQAVQKGALAVVAESAAPGGFPGSWIQVGHGRKALAVAARRFYGRPDERLRLTGITGTNGKTTTSYLLDSILKAAGHTTALIGTIQHHVAGRTFPAVNTTPESLDLYRMLAELEQAGGAYATLECSSHALALGRLYGFQIHTAVYTNFSRDHLDFHRTMENYFAAKQLLFLPEGAPPPRFAVLNADDEGARGLAIDPRTELLWYSRSAQVAPGRGRMARGRLVSSGFQGVRFDLQFQGKSWPIESSLIGEINVSNILAACTAALCYEIDFETIARGVAACRSIPGRFERVEEGQPFLVAVDYAHTDDALKNLIRVARALSPRRVITLFGCGGDRDRTKRPLMGEAAGAHSDFVILTSDNPRSEDPLGIINDALVGLRRHDVPHIIEPDRAKAIQRAIQEAGQGDIVLIAGKGHETYQVLKDGAVPFDDREVARAVLRSMGYGRSKP